MGAGKSSSLAEEAAREMSAETLESPGLRR
jgi:hypothetical protein